MSGMRELSIRRNALCANATSSHHANQSPTTKRGGDGKMARRKGGRKTMMQKIMEKVRKGKRLTKREREYLRRRR